MATILDDIIAQYKDLFGQFLQADSTLVRIRNKIASNRSVYGMYESQYQEYRAEYDLLDRTLQGILDRVSLIKFGRGAEVRITELINGIYNFASRCERLLKNIGELEVKLFGSTKLTGMKSPLIGLIPIALVGAVATSLLWRGHERKR